MKVVGCSLLVFRATSPNALYSSMYPAILIGTFWNQESPTIVSFRKRLGFLDAGGVVSEDHNNRAKGTIPGIVP